MKLILGEQTINIQKETFSILKSWAEKPWHWEIYHFLEQWFDQTEYIEMKTSGSTGEPKKIKLRKETMMCSAMMTNKFFRMRQESISLLCLPASYIAGKMMLVRAIAGNYTLIAVEPAANPFAEDKLPVIDFTAITPYQLVHAAKDIPGKKIHHIIVGGSQVTPAMEKIVSDWESRVYETFGMTETASHIALRCINGTEKSGYFQTLDGVALSLDKRGCLVINAPHLSAEELITNDLVELKDSHSFRWLGRIDRVINSGGIKIFPEQVERKLQSLIDRPFFIFGRSDEKLGQQVVLVLESAQLSDSEVTALQLAMKSQLDRYEVPGKIICVSEFVYSAGNKVLRKETLELLKNTLSE